MILVSIGILVFTRYARQSGAALESTLDIAL